MDRVKRIKLDGQYLDVSSGEVVKPFGERFMFIRLTDGLDWMKELNAQEIRCYMFLASKTISSDNRISLDKRVKKQLCSFLDVHERTMYRIMGGDIVTGKQIGRAHV